jgi:hypothetical protein
VTAAQRAAAEYLNQPGAGGDHRAHLDHEHHRVMDLHAGVKLGEALNQPAADDVRAEQ